MQARLRTASPRQGSRCGNTFACSAGKRCVPDCRRAVFWGRGYRAAPPWRRISQGDSGERRRGICKDRKTLCLASVPRLDAPLPASVLSKYAVPASIAAKRAWPCKGPLRGREVRGSGVLPLWSLRLPAGRKYAFAHNERTGRHAPRSNTFVLVRGRPYRACAPISSLLQEPSFYRSPHALSRVAFRRFFHAYCGKRRSWP